MRRPRQSGRRKAAVAAGYRSNFEKEIADDLKKRGIDFKYENRTISYLRPVRGGLCTACDSKGVAKRSVYTPDFEISTTGNGFILEAKGRLTSADRSKLKLVRGQYPALDLRLLFQANNWTTKLKRERYMDWGLRNGFVCHVGKVVPRAWLEG